MFLARNKRNLTSVPVTLTAKKTMKWSFSRRKYIAFCVKMYWYKKYVNISNDWMCTNLKDNGNIFLLPYFKERWKLSVTVFSYLADSWNIFTEIKWALLQLELLRICVLPHKWGHASFILDSTHSSINMNTKL
jgi:hypothetical protein